MRDVTIEEFAKQLVNIIGYEGKISVNSIKFDGVLRKLMDSWRLQVSAQGMCAEMVVSDLQLV